MARIPSSGRGAIVLVATVSLLISLVNWAISTILTALLVIALAKRKELNMDYRAAAAAAIIGMGATWALGISSSAAQLQANKTSLPESIYNLTGVIPFTETIFLWQSIAMTIILVIVSIAIAYWSAPKGIALKPLIVLMCNLKKKTNEAKSTRPGDWLENSPILTIIVVVLGLIWMFLNFQKQSHHCHFKSQYLQLRVFNAWVSFTWHTTELFKCCCKSSSGSIGHLNSISTVRKYRLYYDPSFK